MDQGTDDSESIMARTDAAVVQTVGLTKVFRDFWRRPRVEAVKDLNLQIRAGEVFGLLGPNGSGKTTTIKMLLGLLYPTRGRISVFGAPPSEVRVKSRIGFLPEESYLYRYLVAHETLDFYGRLFRLPGRIRKDRADRLLDMVGLRHEAKRPIGEYSKGMARRIGLAQALINDPEFLILDEPTSGLDPVGAAQIKEVIRALGRKGKTILLSSHVLSDVEDVCDRVTILYGGQQRAAGDISELLRKRDVTQITTPALSEETIAQIRETVRRLEQKDIIGVTNPRDRLEEFFLRIVEEARMANVRTSGAVSGGAVPEFLQKPAQATADAYIESLVSAGAHTVEPLRETSPRERKVGPGEPARDVLQALLGQVERADESEAAVTEVEKAASLAGKEPSREGVRLPVDADRGVLDELLRGGDGRGRDEHPKGEG